MSVAFPQKSYAGLIFDCDGTLTDSMPVHYLAWNRTMSRYSIQFDEARFYALGGMPTTKIIELLSGEQNIKVDADAVATEKEQAFVDWLYLLQPIDEVISVASHFRGKLPMAVASGGFRDVIEKQLQQIGCADWFDAIVTAEDTDRHKPEPDVFLEAARRIGVPPSECLVYEDSDLGLQAASAAGMDFIDVRAFFTPHRLAPELYS